MSKLLHILQFTTYLSRLSPLDYVWKKQLLKDKFRLQLEFCLQVST